jgi:hypothetical protein
MAVADEVIIIAMDPSVKEHQQPPPRWHRFLMGPIAVEQGRWNLLPSTQGKASYSVGSMMDFAGWILESHSMCAFALNFRVEEEESDAMERGNNNT